LLLLSPTWAKKSWFNFKVALRIQATRQRKALGFLLFGDMGAAHLGRCVFTLDHLDAARATSTLAAPNTHSAQIRIGKCVFQRGQNLLRFVAMHATWRTVYANTETPAFCTISHMRPLLRLALRDHGAQQYRLSNKKTIFPFHRKEKRYFLILTLFFK